ncbi:hypothetical protein [Streptacidiphilus sp. EB129]|uniref:hypothetical protein n=1 Tax=Streptacidiphilus sp. EB129 TaxID=3156262 RepID=UPI003518FCB3
MYYDAPGRELTSDELAGGWKPRFRAYVVEDRVWPQRGSDGVPIATWESPADGPGTLNSAELVGTLAGLQAVTGPALRARQTAVGVLYVSCGEGRAWRYIPTALLAASSVPAASPLAS